jgi:hypothetical protein
MARVGGLATSATAALDLDRAPADQVAMVVDERSLCYLRVADAVGNWFLVGSLPALHRIGAPVGHYLVTDLPKLADHKLFFIMTSYAPTEADRKAVEALKGRGHVLVFLYAPGLFRDGKLDEAAMADFTGFRLRLKASGGPLNLKLSGGDAITGGLEGLIVGAGQDVSPTVYADDPGATTLGAFPDGSPAMAIRRFGSWTSVFSAVPIFQAELLRRLAQEAGVHLYVDTQDVVWADRDLVAVCVREGGERTIHLPRRADVADLYTGAEVARGATDFRADFKPLATRVFVLK